MGVWDASLMTVLDALKHHHKIRLSGIDTPQGGQAFGYRSNETHAACAIGMRARVDADKSDCYQRRVTCQPVRIAGRTVVKTFPRPVSKRMRNTFCAPTLPDYR